MAQGGIRQEGEEALLQAAEKGNKVKVIELLGQGINPNVVSAEGPTPLQKAFMKRHFEVAELLINAGANLNDRYRQGTSEGSHTLLGYLALWNRGPLVKKVMDYNPDPNLHFYENNESFSNALTPLHDMIKNKNFPLIKQCLGIGGDPTIPTSTNKTSVEWAIERGNSDETITLLKKFEQFYSLTTATVDINTKQLIPNEQDRPPETLQLPNEQDLEQKNLEYFSERFIKNLHADTVTSGKKIEKLKANLELLSKIDHYPNLLRAIHKQLTPPSLEILAAKKIVSEIPKGQISLLDKSSVGLAYDTIKQVAKITPKGFSR